MKAASYTALWALLCSLFLVSCDKENPAYNRENIRATWVFDTKDGSLIPEEEYTIYEFITDGIVYLEGIQNLGDGDYKWGKKSLSYNVYCCDLKISGVLSGFNDVPAEITIEQEYEIIDQKDSSLTISPTLYKVNNIDVTPDYDLATMRKLPSNYASKDSLTGVWEENSKDGVPQSTFRFEFLENGKLNFYLKDISGGWKVISTENEDYYNPYPNTLVMTLYNNELFGTNDKWDVSYFKILSLSAFSKKMKLSKDDVEYSFTMIESQGPDDETL